MLRRITQTLGRFQVGELHEYPIDVWRKIARDGSRPLDEFSEVIEEQVGAVPTSGMPRQKPKKF